MTALPRLVLRRSTTARQVADVLSEQILAGGFAAGDRLRESALATQLGVARNTMREAVRMLELGGLVRYEVNRGAVVIAPTAETVDAVYAARERLETAAVARPVAPDRLPDIERAFDALAAATGSRDVMEIVTRDLEFHAALVALLDSARIDEFYAQLSRELRFYLTVLSVHDREYDQPAAVLAEHRVILDAVRAGDPARTVREVHDHISRNATRLHQIIVERAEPGDSVSP